MKFELTPFRYPACFSTPRRLTDLSAWHEHIPFAMFLVEILKPSTIVELGAHAGDSYCAFCQAVDSLGLNARCYAVDTWRGDPHSGYYGEDVLSDLQRHHDPLYGAFSSLVRSTFDEAAARFADGTIDLLHIDGNHTYQSAKHDFETWLPKMSRRGVVLFHDICVKEFDFTVYKLWDELKSQYKSFNFLHGHGLGVLAVGSEYPREVQDFLNLSEEETATIRSVFFDLGHRLALHVHEKRVETELEQLTKEMGRLRMTVEVQRRELDDIHAGVGWKLVRGFTRLANAVLPAQTRRRQVFIRIARVARVIDREGWGSFFRRVKNQLLPQGWEEMIRYRLWISRYEPRKARLQVMRTESRSWSYRPTVSIVVPVYNPDRSDLTQCIRSVMDQVYEGWELCLVDGASNRPYVTEIIKEFAARDTRIKYLTLPKNLGIAGNSNQAQALAGGEYVGLLDHDDTLAPFALYEVVKALNEDRGLDCLYSDEDKITPSGAIRYEPLFKPDWSPDTLRSINYVCHFSVIRKSLLDEVGWFREGYDGSQDYDLILRLTERTSRVTRIPKVLYHWRSAKTSVASDPMAKPYAYSAAKRALADHAERLGLAAEVLDGMFTGAYRVKYRVRPHQKVSIVIPTKDKPELLERCVESLLAKTEYQNFDVLVVDNGSCEDRTHALLRRIADHPQVRVAPYARPFNFSAINNYAAGLVDGKYLLFLNNDTEVTSGEWLAAMLEFAQRDDVGAVGAKLIYKNRSIQHAGVIIGMGGVAAHAHRDLPPAVHGYMGRIKIVQNVSAVTAACMMVRRTVFDEVGGFETRLAHAFNDVDLCLKIRAKGYLIVYTPYAELYHHESASRGVEDTPERLARFAQEVELMKTRWKPVLDAGDPYYNPNLRLDRPDFSIRL